MDYFYDSQVRRYIAQFLRIFSDVKVRSDPNENGFSLETRVPIKYGDMSRQVAAILNGNTENVVMSVPTMAGYVTSLKLDPSNRRDTMLVSTAQVTEQKFDNLTQSYENNQGNSYSVERYMPVPYVLQMRLDIMTSNTDSKLQILEQLLTIFNPSIQLQQNENVVDWSRVFEVELTNINWSNRSIPVGAETQYDIATLDFDMNIWINPAAKEKRQRIIKNIITRVFDTDEDPIDWENPFPNEVAQVNVTADNLHLGIEQSGSGYSGRLLSPQGVPSPDVTWKTKLDKVGDIIPNETRIKLRLADDLDDESGDVYGTVTGTDPSDDAVLYFNIDPDSLPQTLPQSPITKFIDPSSTYPTHGIDVSDTSVTHRYAILSEQTDGEAIIIPDNQFWGGLTAYNNDIIEYSNGVWYVVFSAIESPANVYVESISDGNHYRYTGEEWAYTLLGTFTPTYWSLLDIRSS